MQRCLAVVALATAASACASINPTLVPARVLAGGRGAVDLGSAYNAPVSGGALVEARDADVRVRGGTSTPEDQRTLERAAVLYGANPPGVATYVAGRLGMGNGVEGHVALMGRVVRVGARRVFWTDDVWALSLGLQGRLALLASAINGAVPGLSVSESRLYGGDVSMVFGRTNSELYDVWLGVRAGFTYGNGVMSLSQLGPSPFGADGARFDVSTVLGGRVGFGRLAVLMELETTFTYAWGHTTTGTSASGAGITLIPGGALAWSF